MPKVSIVMPFLNGGNFIGEAVASVLAQDFADWELILVDDGSTDSSAGFAAELARQHSNVAVVHHPRRENCGLAASRVRGSDRATGEYLMFLDHDDLLFPDALSSLVHVLEQNRAAAAVFATTVYWAFDRSIADEDSVQSHYPLRSGMISGGAMLRDLIRSDHHHPANCSTLYRREALLEVRDMTSPYDGMYEDTALLFKLLCRNDVYLLEKPVSSYRIHRGSMSHQAQAQGTFAPTAFNTDRQRFLRWVGTSGLPLDLRSRARLRWTLLHYRVQAWLGKVNARKTQAALAYVFARL
jgi:glycosyltransferase involved in cell wall biosynthesis